MSDAVDLVCPIHRAPLRADGDVALRDEEHDESFPVVDGIPVLIADAGERSRIAGTDWQSDGAPSQPTAADFYNRQIQEEERYFRKQLESTRRRLAGWLEAVRCPGPALEIGSGRGVLQGTGADYLAVDYSLTALRDHVEPRFRRVCASAEHLPFPDATFAFIFTVATLEHVPRADLAFDEIHRVLKPGGVAFLLPAWHCVQYRCEGIGVRPYRDLTWRQRLVKLTLPIRQQPAAKALATLPGRTLRRTAWWLTGRGPTRFRFRALRPDYTHYWGADADAAARLDSHEACLYFHSRDYELLSPRGGAIRQLLARHLPVVVRKPG